MNPHRTHGHGVEGVNLMKKGKGAVKPAGQQRGSPVQASVGTGTSPPVLLASSPALGVPAHYLCWATEEEKGR